MKYWKHVEIKSVITYLDISARFKVETYNLFNMKLQTASVREFSPHLHIHLIPDMCGSTWKGVGMCEISNNFTHPQTMACAHQHWFFQSLYFLSWNKSEQRFTRWPYSPACLPDFLKEISVEQVHLSLACKDGHHHFFPTTPYRWQTGIFPIAITAFVRTLWSFKKDKVHQLSNDSKTRHIVWELQTYSIPNLFS